MNHCFSKRLNLPELLITVLTIPLCLIFSSCQSTSSPSIVSNFKNLFSHQVVSSDTISFKDNLLQRLKTLEVDKPKIIAQLSGRDTSAIEIDAAVPLGKPWEWIIWYCSQAIDQTDYSVADCYWQKEQKKNIIEFASADKKKPPVTVVLSRCGRYFKGSAVVAIIIDGYSFRTDKASIDFLSFPSPLTLSLDPAEPNITRTAQLAVEKNKEIIIALPMESIFYADKRRAENMIMVHFPEERINSIIAAASEKIPGYKGFTNRWGQRVLEDNRATTIILNIVAEHHSYFIEDPVSNNSNALAAAQSMDLPYYRINAICTDTSSSGQIEKFLRQQIPVALNRGKLLIRCPSGQSTIDALVNMLSVFNQCGIDLVFASKLCERSDSTNR